MTKELLLKHLHNFSKGANALEPDQPSSLHVPWLTSHGKHGLGTFAQRGEAADRSAMHPGRGDLQTRTGAPEGDPKEQQ